MCFLIILKILIQKLILKFKKLFQEAYCADVLVGVHGASLTWSAFQKPNTTNIEIAWPKYGWPFVYSTSNMHALVCAVIHPCTLLCFATHGFFTEGTS